MCSQIKCEPVVITGIFHFLFQACLALSSVTGDLYNSKGSIIGAQVPKFACSTFILSTQNEYELYEYGRFETSGPHESLLWCSSSEILNGWGTSSTVFFFWLHFHHLAMSPVSALGLRTGNTGVCFTLFLSSPAEALAALSWSYLSSPAIIRNLHFNFCCFYCSHTSTNPRPISTHLVHWPIPGLRSQWPCPLAHTWSSSQPSLAHVSFLQPSSGQRPKD